MELKSEICCVCNVEMHAWAKYRLFESYSQLSLTQRSYELCHRFPEVKWTNRLQSATKQTDSTQATYLELHTWYRYESLDSYNPTEGTVPVKVFTVRNLSDSRRSDVFRGQFV